MIWFYIINKKNKFNKFWGKKIIQKWNRSHCHSHSCWLVMTKILIPSSSAQHHSICWSWWHAELAKVNREPSSCFHGNSGQKGSLLKSLSAWIRAATPVPAHAVALARTGSSTDGELYTRVIFASDYKSDIFSFSKYNLHGYSSSLD